MNNYVHIKFPASGGRDQWEDFPSGLLAISRGGRIFTGKILERFKKKSVKKVENFWSKSDFEILDRKIFGEISKNLENLEKSRKIEKSKKWDFN